MGSVYKVDYKSLASSMSEKSTATKSQASKASKNSKAAKHKKKTSQEMEALENEIAIRDKEIEGDQAVAEILAARHEPPVLQAELPANLHEEDVYREQVARNEEEEEKVYTAGNPAEAKGRS